VGVVNERKNRGVAGILLAAWEGLRGFPDAVAAAFPGAEVRLCMRIDVRVSLVRNPVRFVPYKDRLAGKTFKKKLTKKTWAL
jgi:transposase-like protein